MVILNLEGEEWRGFSENPRWNSIEDRYHMRFVTSSINYSINLYGISEKPKSIIIVIFCPEWVLKKSFVLMYTCSSIHQWIFLDNKIGKKKEPTALTYHSKLLTFWHRFLIEWWHGTSRINILSCDMPHNLKVNKKIIISFMV